MQFVCPPPPPVVAVVVVVVVVPGTAVAPVEEQLLAPFERIIGSELR